MIKKWKETGKLEEEHSTGRIASYTAKDMAKLKRIMKQNDAASPEELFALMGDTAPRVSSRTIQNYRHFIGYTPRRTQPEVQLTDAESSHSCIRCRRRAF